MFGSFGSQGLGSRLMDRTVHSSPSQVIDFQFDIKSQIIENLLWAHEQSSSTPSLNMQFPRTDGNIRIVTRRKKHASTGTYYHEAFAVMGSGRTARTIAQSELFPTSKDALCGLLDVSEDMVQERLAIR